ncbi:hypothetical protein HYU45_01735 [Candidatus Daviesbacteria bacterium]|nr:hypothetical protein [Candidatus Daviesbacteria bacterium]
MKLISLNTWGGKIYQPLIDFIKQHSTDTDIFCFQEIFSTTSNITEQSGFRLNLNQEITAVLKNHQGYFASCVNNYIVGSFQTHFVDFSLSSGLAIFINKKFPVRSYSDLFVYGKKDSFNPKDLNSLPRNIQYINFLLGNKEFTICNIHGIWVKGGKGDTPSRIQQSKQIRKLLETRDGGKILCGDFNLGLDTESIKILDSSMINLIKKYNIETTRSKFYPRSDKFADYTFISPDVKVTNFQVPDIEVSDHLPMILEFS